jgi:hypothetical protein
VTDGELDGDDHPMVVLLLMEVGGAPAFRCSGTLLAPQVLLTAGHCTNNFPDDPYTGMRVFTESDVQAGIGTTNNSQRWSEQRQRSSRRIRYETGSSCCTTLAKRHTGIPGVVLPSRQYGVLHRWISSTR